VLHGAVDTGGTREWLAIGRQEQRVIQLPASARDGDGDGRPDSFDDFMVRLDYSTHTLALPRMVGGYVQRVDDAPASYPPILDGWHYGKWTGSYGKANAKAISALTSVASSWAFTPPAGQTWDIA
jgi:hypothetical protein